MNANSPTIELQPQLFITSRLKGNLFYLLIWKSSQISLIKHLSTPKMKAISVHDASPSIYRFQKKLSSLFWSLVQIMRMSLYFPVSACKNFFPHPLKRGFKNSTQMTRRVSENITWRSLGSRRTWFQVCFSGACPFLKLAPAPLPGTAFPITLPEFMRHGEVDRGIDSPGEKKMFISSLDQLPAPVPHYAHK